MCSLAGGLEDESVFDIDDAVSFFSEFSVVRDDNQGGLIFGTEREEEIDDVVTVIGVEITCRFVSEEDGWGVD